MKVTELEISLDDAGRLVESDEGQFLDLKRVDIAPAKLSRTLSAFANADGGEVLLGIADGRGSRPNQWSGFSRKEDANAHVQVADAVVGLTAGATVEFLTCGELPGVVLRILVPKAASVVTATDSIPYLRRGSQSLPYGSPEQRQQLELAKGIRSHERATLQIPLELVTNSESVIGFMLEIVPQGEPELWLRKQLLVDGDLPTVAGVLLFADEPQTVLPKASIKIYRYRTSGEASRDVLVADPETIEGCVYRQVYDAVGRVQSLVESIPTMSKDGLQLQRYPGVTIHEIITNAVLHRDYSVQDDIHVRIFDNRIEVESPGRLPAHITSENILSERFARNPTVVRLINKFPDPPNKDVGEGLNSAFEAMRRLRLKPPQIVETDHSVLVHIRHEKLASPGQQIMEFLGEHDEIRNRQAREITGIGSENEMKRIFQRMMKAGEIESIPGRSRPLSAYRIAGADSVMSDANLDSG